MIGIFAGANSSPGAAKEKCAQIVDCAALVDRCLKYSARSGSFVLPGGGRFVCTAIVWKRDEAVLIGNDHIRRDWRTMADGCIDLAGDTRLADPMSDNEQFFDATRTALSAAGREVVAEIISQVLNT